MSRPLTYLLLVLVIQCALVATVYWPHTAPGYGPQESMLPVERERVDEIYVGDEFDNETVLRKVGGRWSLPELENLPADTAKVEKLLDAIMSGNDSWPAASSIAARQRFRVATYHYRRRIKFLGNLDVLGTLYLGASPGFRKVYARNEAQDAIYSILFNAHDAPGNSDAWLDRKLLQTRTPVRIDADDYSLQLEGAGWLSGTGQAPEARELEALLLALRSLQIDGVASEDEQRDLAESEAERIFRIESLAGEVTLELFSQGDQYFIHSSEYPLFFTLGAYDYDRLASIDARLISGEPAG